MDHLNKEDFEKLSKLVSFGFKVVCIEGGGAYVTSHFVPADGKGQTHTKLTGKRIFLDDQKIANATIHTIQLTLDNIPSLSYWIHPDIKYIQFGE